MRQYKLEISRQAFLEALVHGNLHKEDALKLTNLVEKIFESRPSPFTEFIGKRSVIIPEGSHYIYPRVLKDPKNVNNCIEYLLFVGRGWEKKSRALLNLFIQVTEEYVTVGFFVLQR